MRTESQNKQIYDWMKSGNSITDREADSLFRCRRLSARILDIHKKYGIEIKRKMQYKGDIKYMKYWI